MGNSASTRYQDTISFGYSSSYIINMLHSYIGSKEVYVGITPYLNNNMVYSLGQIQTNSNTPDPEYTIGINIFSSYKKASEQLSQCRRITSYKDISLKEDNEGNGQYILYAMFWYNFKGSLILQRAGLGVGLEPVLNMYHVFYDPTKA